MPFVYECNHLPVHLKNHMDFNTPTFAPLPRWSMSGGTGNNDFYSQNSTTTLSVPEALELARENEWGAQDPTVLKVLENAIDIIWARIQAEPTSYLMNRDEFAVFNYFQRRFEGQAIATGARKRFWDNLSVSTDSDST